MHRELLKSVQHTILEGKIEETEVEAATWITSGNLRQHRVVDSLLKTFFEAERNMARGRVTRPGTTQHLCEDTLGELLTTLA